MVVTNSFCGRGWRVGMFANSIVGIKRRASSLDIGCLGETFKDGLDISHDLLGGLVEIDLIQVERFGQPTTFTKVGQPDGDEYTRRYGHVWSFGELGRTKREVVMHTTRCGKLLIEKLE